MKVFKNILTFILALIITVLICLFYATNLLTNTVLSKNFVLSKLDETDYYNQIYVYIESNFEKYINQSGLDEDVVKNLITVDIVKSDTEKIINNMYDNAQESITTETIEQNLRNNIEDFLNTNNLTANKTDIDTFVGTISDEYLNNIWHNKYEQKIYDAIIKMQNISNKVKKIIIVALVITVILLLIINIKDLYNFFAKIGISLFTSGLLFIFTNIFINKKIDVKNILVLNDAISYTLKNIVSEILTKVSKNGILFMIVGLIIIIISNCVKIILNKNKEEV